MFQELENEDIFICEEEEENSSHDIQLTEAKIQKELREKENQDIFVFDDDENHYEEEIVYSKHSEVKMKEVEKRMSQEEYESKCSELQDMIIFTNMTNFTKDLVKPKKRINHDGKIRRGQSEMGKLKRGTVADTINTVLNKQHKRLARVDFFDEPAKESKNKDFDCVSNNRQTSRIEESFIEDDLSQKRQPIQQHEIKGATLQRKIDLKMQQFKEQSILKVSNFRQFLFTQLRPNYQIFILIKRTQNGLINSTYKFYFQENDKFIMSCEKQGFTKYVFSSSDTHISQEHISYLGKMETNFSGTDFTVYDFGEDCTRTKMMEKYKKQLAYTSYFQEKGQPRRFQTFITTCDNKSTDFTIKDNNDNVIQDKWISNNRRNICKLMSKQPKYDPLDCSYKLDFKGLAEVASTKNFIVDSPEYPDALIFGRQTKDTYLMRVKSPFSLMQALALGMSSIHYKFI